LALAGVGLLSGLDAALARLGVLAPVPSPSLASVHGVLMVYGFLGTAIALERAVAIQAGSGRRHWWAYLAPLASGVGAVTLVARVAGAPLPGWLPGAAWLVGLVLFAGIYLVAWRRQPSRALIVQWLGVLAGLVGMALFTAGQETATLVGWWAALLVLTIVGERLELARVGFLARHTEPRIVVESATWIVVLVLASLRPGWGYPLAGLVLGVLMVDMLVHDVARRTIHARGLTRLMAGCMLAGYAWALVAALVWLVAGPVWAGYPYDLVVHALTIGFAVSMVVAHAPIIVPAIVRRSLPYHQVMWAVIGLLNAGLVIRALAGLRDSQLGWQFGGSLSVVALVVFLVSTVTLVALGPRRTTGPAYGSRTEPHQPSPVDQAQA
jgi:nitrite reductase (NO-forming)